jgi:microsomal epoxide hydrolase
LIFLAPTHLGFDQIDTAKLFIQLMKDLSYGEYYVQGGDWGAIVTGIMAYYDPNIIGYHTNFPLGMVILFLLRIHLFFLSGYFLFSNYIIGFPAWRRGVKLLLKNLLVFQFPSFFIPKEEMPFFERSKNLFEAFSVTGYLHLQMTKPQTIGYALNDSPVGLAAWIIEKYE